MVASLKAREEKKKRYCIISCSGTRTQVQRWKLPNVFPRTRLEARPSPPATSAFIKLWPLLPSAEETWKWLTCCNDSSSILAERWLPRGLCHENTDITLLRQEAAGVYVLSWSRKKQGGERIGLANPSTEREFVFLCAPLHECVCFMDAYPLRRRERWD